MQKINSKNNKSQEYDVIVIGGGPAGMMAAGRAGENGSRVLLIEKNQTLGKKLLLTGNGRCNLTHAEFDDKQFVKSLGKKGKFLFSALSAFGPEEVMEFFQKMGVPTKQEKGGKIFPVSDKAQDVLDTLEKYLQQNKVKILTQTDVLGFVLDKNKKKISGVKLVDKTIYADKFILATGGVSYPLTGSTGDGYAWARECGHSIVTSRPILVPLKTEESWVKELQGVSLKNVKISLVCDKSSIETPRRGVSIMGDLIFTHFGLSGPAILNFSRTLAEVDSSLNKFLISIDLKPEMSKQELDYALQKEFTKHINKNIANYLPLLVPQKLVDIILRLAAIPAEKKINVLTKEERLQVVDLLKDFRLIIVGNTGFAQAMVTRGGVELKEVNPKTMQSKILPNLYLVGEVLDLDGPTGGYNLQIAWSTGYAAGTACGDKGKIFSKI